MSTVEYLEFNKIDKNEFLPLLNSKRIRKHLIKHELFTIDTLTTWMHTKLEVDATSGCKVRGIVVDGELAGWCGIQLEDDKYELAIIIDKKFWGLGKKVFKDMMRWAKELEHKVVYIHFLHTRPEYKFLKKIASAVYKTELFDSTFTTYQLSV
jgi:hypothetical protein